MANLTTKGGQPLFILNMDEIMAVYGHADGENSSILFKGGYEVPLKGEPIQVMDFLFPPLEEVDEPQFIPGITEDEAFFREKVREAYISRFGDILPPNQDPPEEWLESIREKI